VLGNAAPPSNPGFASIEGDHEAYLLLSGPVAVREGAAAALRAVGVTVIRAGRYLGDSVDGYLADWFVRFEKPTSDEPIDGLLARVLGQPNVAPDTSAGETALETRLRLLQDEMARARVREATLRSELVRAKAAALAAPATGNDAPRIELINEQRLRYDAEAAWVAAEAALSNARAELEAAHAKAAVPRQASPRTRVHDEISDVLGTLLPHLDLLRDSLTVAASEYASRKALYRSLAELATVEGRLPSNWKAVQGVAGWWERHVSDGKANTGRLYARSQPGTRRWDVLISDKAEQARDMTWLRRRAFG
jgi:hypothetical protein